MSESESKKQTNESRQLNTNYNTHVGGATSTLALESLNKKQKREIHVKMSLLPSDIWIVISLWFMPEDFLSFIQCSKETYSLIKIEKWKKIFEERWLKDAHHLLVKDLETLNLHNVIKFVSNEQAIIAGSYPLKFLSKSTYQAGDIDVFVPYTEERYRNICNYFNGSQFKSKNVRDPFTLNPYRVLPALKRIKLFASSGAPNVQINFIDSKLFGSDMKEYIKASFDFSFCKCWYDAKSMGCHNLYATIRRMGSLNLNEDTLTTYEKGVLQDRVRKYRNRDFIILNI